MLPHDRAASGPRTRSGHRQLSATVRQIARSPPGSYSAVQPADLGCDGRDVNRCGRVHGNQRADADRPVVPFHLRQCYLLQPVDLVPRPGVVAGDRDFGRARAVHTSTTLPQRPRSLSSSYVFARQVAKRPDIRQVVAN